MCCLEHRKKRGKGEKDSSCCGKSVLAAEGALDPVRVRGREGGKGGGGGKQSRSRSHNKEKKGGEEKGRKRGKGEE